MAAFCKVISRNAVSEFCSLGGEMLNGPPCLLAAKWETALDALEKARNDPSLLQHVASLQVNVVTEIVRHYNAMYTRCTELIVMPFQRWKQWHDGLGFFMTESANEPTGTLSKLCEGFILSQQERFAVVFWGCWSSVAIRLNSFLARLASSAILKEDNDKAVVGNNLDDDVSIYEEEEEEAKANNVSSSLDQSISNFRRRCFFELYFFQRLANDAAHLFDLYPLVGKAERQWLSEKLLRIQDEKAVEAVIRCSFKRDFCVPSVDLESGALVEEYEAFEVNESKAKLLEKKADGTLKGPWCATSRELLKFETTHIKGKPLESCASDGSWRGLLDELVECLCKKVGRADLALAVTMQRILEKEPFPAVFEISRLKFALSLFLRWFEAYVGDRHSREIPFFSKADLWVFVLERHTELLKWAVFYYCNNGAGSDLTCALESIKTVCFSVQHCLDIYITNSFSKRLSEEAKKKLCQQAKEKVCDWFRHTALTTFIGGVQHLCSENAEGVVRNDGFAFCPALFATRTALVKSQLMLLCDASLFAMDVRQELLPVIGPSFERMSRITEGDEDTVLQSNWTTCMLGVLNTLRLTMRCSADGGSETLDNFAATLHSHYRDLKGLSPLFMKDLVSDAWTDFLSTDGRHVCGSRRVALTDVVCTRRDNLDGCNHTEEQDPPVGATKRKRPRKK